LEHNVAGNGEIGGSHLELIPND